MKKILLQLDCDRLPSPFDAITAYDAGTDHLLQYGGVTPREVRDLVYGAMFTRGGDDLKNSVLFIGGSDVSIGEEILKEAVGSFFGPTRVSVMMDSNGCNTTAAAAVRKMTLTGSITEKRIVVLGGTGPVGMRAAAMLAREGARVTLTSRSRKRSEEACALIKDRFDADILPEMYPDSGVAGRLLEGVYGILCCGAAGTHLLSESIWKDHPTLRVLADVNAVPPLGIEGTKSHWDGKEIGNKVVYGALGIGGLKMKVHRKCLTRLFERNDLVLDAEEIYDIAREMDA